MTSYITTKEHNRMMQELKAANEQMRQRLDIRSDNDGSIYDEIDVLEAALQTADFDRHKLNAENERLRDVLRTAHRALETLGLGKTTRETAMRLIDEALK